MSKRRFYLTTAIAYTNASPHIGFALELLYADVIARDRRLRGDEVLFLTGTDEQGQKIAAKATDAGETPIQFTDHVSAEFRDLAQRLNITNDDFIRTTEARHRVVVESFWKRVSDNGWIYKKAYQGLYCTGCEEFKTEKDLVDGKCPIHLIAVQPVEEENYFFKLSAFRDQLQALYAERPDFVVPAHKFNEAKGLVEGGLEDMSISRSTEHLTWGIPVPGDSSQVIYVWFDALVNYLTAAGFESDEKRFAETWPADLHVIGKEINRFHTVLWPAMLMAAGIEVPRRIGVHGWITVDGQKMSKSLGNIIDPEVLREKYGTEGLRYLLLREVPFSGDGDYSEERAIARYDADLANNLGNLVYRVTSMLAKYRESIVPERVDGVSAPWESFQSFVDEYRFDQALGVTWEYLASVNQMIDQDKPWTLAKEGKDAELSAALYRYLESIRQVGWMIRAFLPETSEKILTTLGQETDGKTYKDISSWGLLESGKQIASASPLFPRIEQE